VAAIHISPGAPGPVGILGAPGGPAEGNPNRPYFEERNYLIAGVTLDASGNPLAGCTVKLYSSDYDKVEYTAISDAGGNYAFAVDKRKQYYVVSYLAGSPDVCGTTVNTLQGV
jgi:hypothetical protein